MKKAKLFTLLAFVLTLAACNKDKEELRHERDIVYTVAEKTTTAHLETEAEWQALLDRFCDWAEDGSMVTFHSERKSPKGPATKEATTFSTTDREAMKHWMQRMEDEGKTVTITYDSSTGTYNGMAYANASQPQQAGCYTGVLTYAPMHAMEAGPVPPGLEWVLQVGDTTFWLVADGHFITAIGPMLVIDSVNYAEGDSITLCGNSLMNEDYYGNHFYCLIIDGTWSTPSPYSNFAPVYIGHTDYGTLILTIDNVHHLIYSTSTLADQGWQGAIGGGVFHYTETGISSVYPVVEVYSDVSGGGGEFSLQMNADGSLTFRDLNHYPTDNIVHTLGEVQMHRTYDYETWVYEGSDYNVVFHLFCGADVPHREGFCSSPFYVNCLTPFRIGDFHLGACDEGMGVWWNGDAQAGTVFNYEYHSDYQLLLTPTDNNNYCDESWLFNRK